MLSLSTFGTHSKAKGAFHKLRDSGLKSKVHPYSGSTAIKNRRLPQGVMTNIMHILSMLVAVGITVLSARTTYFQDVSTRNINLKLEAFQFAAKIHDIIVTYSLSSVVLYYYLNALCDAEGLPVGYLNAPFQLSSPMSLFRPEFFHVMGGWSRKRHAGTASDRRSLRFGALIFLSTIMTAVISPLSAVLIVPQLGWWDVPSAFGNSILHTGAGENSGLTYWNATYDSLWPSRITSSVVNIQCSDDDCPWAGSNTITGWVVDLRTQRVPANLIVPVQAGIGRSLSGGNNGNFDKGYVAASTPMGGLTRNIGALWIWAERLGLSLSRVGQPVIRLRTTSKDLARQIMRPLVQAQCSPPLEITQGGTVSVSFPSDQIKLAAGEPSHSANISKIWKVSDIFDSDDFRSEKGNIRPNLKFLDLSETTGRPLLGALFDATFGGTNDPMPNTTGVQFESLKNPVSRCLYACTMVQHWVPSALFFSPKSVGVIGSDDHIDPASWTAGKYLPPTTRPVAVTLDYIKMISEYGITYCESSSGAGTSTFPYLSSLAALANTPYFYDGTWAINTHIATILSLQTADTLARIQYYQPMFAWYLGKQQSSYISNNLADLDNAVVYGNPNAQNQRILGHADEIRAHPELYTEVEWIVQRNGYAWSLGTGWRLGSNTLKRVALLVILIHVLIVIMHYGNLARKAMQRTGGKFVTWDTPLSLFLLALQTPEKYVRRLRGTGVRVPSTSIYRDIVRIEEGDDVFEIPVAPAEPRVKQAVFTVHARSRAPAYSTHSSEDANQYAAVTAHDLEMSVTNESVVNKEAASAAWVRLRPDVKYF